MGHFFKFIQCLSADPLRRRRWIVIFGMCFFQCQQLRIHTVIFIIRKLRIIIHIILFGMIRDLRTQCFQFLFDILHPAFLQPKKCSLTQACSPFIIPIFSNSVNPLFRILSELFLLFKQIMERNVKNLCFTFTNIANYAILIVPKKTCL